jgi:hypothetical protein
MRFSELKLCDLFVIPMPGNDSRVMAKTGIIKAQSVRGRNKDGRVLYNLDQIEVNPNLAIMPIDESSIRNLVS